MTGRISRKRTILALLIAVVVSLPPRLDRGYAAHTSALASGASAQPGTRRTLRAIGLGVSAGLGHRRGCIFPGTTAGLLEFQVQQNKQRLTQNRRPSNGDPG